jgi:hypothetical protein
LKSDHDFLIISSGMQEINSIISSSKFKDATLVVYAQKGNTSFELISALLRQENIEVLLHD